MPVTEGQKYKLLVLQVRFLREKLKIHENTSETAMVEFEKGFTEMIDRLPDHQKEVITKADEQTKTKNQALEVPPPVAPKKAAPEKFKKLFREIAKATHPDKLDHLSDIERAQKTALFERASQALKDQDLVELVEVAGLLHLTIDDPGPDEIKKIKSGIERVRKKIKNIENTASWSWYHMGGIKREEYMKSYISHVYHQVKRK